MKVLFFIVLFVVFLLGNFYVVYRAWAAMPPNPIGRTIIILIPVISILSLILVFVAGKHFPVLVTSVLYKIGSSWIFIFLYFLMFNLLKDFIGFLVRQINFIPNDAVTRYTKENWIGFAFMVGFIALLMICGYLKYRWKVRVEQPVTVEKIFQKKDSLSTTDSLKIVAISDLHLGYTIGEKELSEWVELINKEDPDIILIAGDIIDNGIRPLNEGSFADCFKGLKSKYGVYACLGNHEYITGVNESIDFISRTGIHLLRDSVAEIDNSFYIVGRDDRMNPERKPLADLIKDIDKSKPIILLDHQPYNLEQAEQNGIDLQISGHTHRGQVWPISLIADMIYEKSFGYLKKGNANIYVSSGIGIWGGKFRIGTQSEYIVINMKSK